MDARARRVLAPALSHQCSTCFDERLACVCRASALSTGAVASGTRRSGPWVDHPSSRPRRRRLFPDCARDPPMCPMHKSACPLSCVCVYVCVYVRVCMCVCVCVYEAHRDESSANHDPRPTSSVFSNAAPVTGGGGGSGWSRPISNIQHLAVHGLVWSGLSSGPPRLAGPVYSLRGRSKDGDHACHPIERLRRASALRWRFREGSSRRPMVLDGGVPSSSSSTPWPAR